MARRVYHRSLPKPSSYKALFVADIHMSNSLPHAKHGENGITDRLQDQVNLLHRIFDTARRNRCKAIFVLGDLFDHSRVDAITLIATVKTLADTPVDLYLVPGNHDGVNTRGERFTVEALSAVENLHYMKTGDPVRPYNFDWLYFWSLEFAPLDRTRHMLSSLPPLKSNTVNVLLMHNSISGCVHGEWVCDKGLGLDAPDLCSRFDHVLSGHFHKSQEFGTSGRYLGAPMHLRLSDAGNDAGFWIMEFDQEGSRTEELIDGGAPRFHVIDFDDGNFERVDLSDMCKHDYVRVRVNCTHAELTLVKSRVEGLVSQLRAQYLRASWFHDPKYQHAYRIAPEQEDHNGITSVRAMIPGYVDAPEVDTSGLDRKELRALGQDIFQKVESQWQD